MPRRKKKKKERFEFTPEQRTEEPVCPYFGRCGGCRYQDVPYPMQVEAKAGWLSRLFEQPVPVQPSPEQYGYRNRMDFVYAFGKLGMRERGTYKWVVDIEHCPLMSRNANDLLSRVRSLLEQYPIECFNYIHHKGYLRYAVIRGTSLGETLVNFVTYDEREDIIPVAEDISADATSVIWSIQDRLADMSYGQTHRVWNTEHIRENIGGKTFLMGPNTFFQNNPYLIEAPFERMRREVQGRVLDLYCGVGSIGLLIAGSAPEVFGVESVEESIRLARRNAEENRVANISFQTAEVRPWLREQAPAEKFETIVVDPPREGLTPKVVKRVGALGADKILYLSCNPNVLRQELELFEDYQVEHIEGYDLFPQTPHVEVLAVLQRKPEKTKPPYLVQR